METNDVGELCHIINEKERELKRLSRVMNLRDEQYIDEKDTELYQALKNSLADQIKKIIVKLEK